MRSGLTGIRRLSAVCWMGAFLGVYAAPLFGQADEPAAKTTVYLHG
jgi:hypothetical protein